MTHRKCRIEWLILGNALGRVEGFSFGGGSGVQQPMEGANGLCMAWQLGSLQSNQLVIG